MQLDLIGGSEKEKQIQFGGVGKGEPVKNKQPAASLFRDNPISLYFGKSMDGQISYLTLSHKGQTLWTILASLTNTPKG